MERRLHARRAHCRYLQKLRRCRCQRLACVSAGREKVLKCPRARCRPKDGQWRSTVAQLGQRQGAAVAIARGRLEAAIAIGGCSGQAATISPDGQAAVPCTSYRMTKLRLRAVPEEQVYGSEEIAFRLRLYAPPRMLRLSGGPSSPPAAPAPPAAAPEELLLPLSTDAFMRDVCPSRHSRTSLACRYPAQNSDCSRSVRPSVNRDVSTPSECSALVRIMLTLVAKVA